MLCLSVAGLVVGASSVAAPNLLLNGNFESGLVTPNGEGGHADTPTPWVSTNPGDGFISFDTWHNDGTNGLPPDYVNVFPGVTAAEGVRWIGGWTFENVAQQLTTTLTPGLLYEVSAFVRMSEYTGGALGRVAFYLGSDIASYEALLFESPDVAYGTGWVHVSGQFLAPTDAASLSYFAPRFVGTESISYYMGIDDIRLVQVPAPGTAALMVGAMSLAALRRRRSWAPR